MWARIINTLLGLWLMAAPALLDHNTAGTNNGHIIGPVIMTFSITAMWEATRGMRRWNLPLAIWLFLAPWILGYENTLAIISDMATGTLLLTFSLYKGKVEQKYGGGWESLWQKNPLHIQKAEEREN